jgi:peptide/nickel transport system permease protein
MTAIAVTELKQERRYETGMLVAGVVLVLIAVAVADPALLARYNPYVIDPARALTGPSGAHWFGTDADGRDVFSRIVYGARPAVLIGFVAAGIGAVGGTVFGLLAGLGARWTDSAVGTFTELLLSFPGVVLALLLATFFGASVTVEAVAVGIGNIPTFIRLVRGQAFVVRSSPYVSAARVLGHSPRRVLLRTIVPNVVRPLLAAVCLAVGQSIVWASTLSFLGLGPKPPEAEWGLMLSDSESYLGIGWWLAVFPGLAIVITALALTTLGTAIQRRLDGRSAP